MNYVRAVTQKGQVTIPAPIRKALGIKARDKVSFRVDEQGVRIEPAKSAVEASYGSVKLRGTKDLRRIRRETERWVAEQAVREL